MPTNRRRVVRRSNRIPVIFTPEYIEHLECADFLGELSEEEIHVAKQVGVYKWDATVKGWHRRKV